MTTAAQTDCIAPANTVAERTIPDDVLALMPAARLKLATEFKMNPVEKTTRASSILNSPAFDVSAHGSDNRRERAQLWAEYYAIKETEKISDLTPDRRAFWIRLARGELPRLQQLESAWDLVHTIEEESLDLPEPSRTAKIVKERRDDARKEICDYLSYTLSEAQIAFLRTFHERRGRRRFILKRTARDYPRPLLLIDVPVRTPYATYAFEWHVERSSALKEIKALCAIWDTAFKVELREGGSAVIGEGFEIEPVNY